MKIVYLESRRNRAGNIPRLDGIYLNIQNCLTKRAPDVWDSAAFSSIFYASSFFCSQAESTPAHTQVTQTVGTPLAQQVNGKLNHGRIETQNS